MLRVHQSCCIAPRIIKDRAGINGIRKLVFKVYCKLKESSVNNFIEFSINGITMNPSCPFLLN